MRISVRIIGLLLLMRLLVWQLVGKMRCITGLSGCSGIVHWTRAVCALVGHGKDGASEVEGVAVGTCGMASMTLAFAFGTARDDAQCTARSTRVTAR